MRFLMLNWRDPKNPLAGGAERVTLAYLAALAGRGHEVYWFANDFPGAAREETIAGIKIVRGGGKGVSVLKAIQWYRQQKHFDLVIDQHHGIPWYAPWWCGTRSVAYVHEILGPIWDSFYSWPLSAIGRRQERWTHWLYRNVPFWTPSESTRKLLLQHGVRQVKVIPNGTDASPLASLENKPLTAPVKLIAVSRLAPNKRVDHVLRATRILLQRGVPARITIVGGGEEEQRLKTLAAGLQLTGNAVFTGSISEAAKDDLLRQSHLLVHTSIREGWGLNVIEANAMGTPAVVYPVGGLVDSTLHGQTGLVVGSETPEAIAEAVESMLKAPEKFDAYRRNAWERSKSFRWEAVLPQACEWLENLASGRGEN
jgi:glycosyltransferase involved in cell wall biosynthesis